MYRVPVLPLLVVLATSTKLIALLQLTPTRFAIPIVSFVLDRRSLVVHPSLPFGDSFRSIYKRLNYDL